MRSVSGAFGRPVGVRCTVHLQGMRSVSGAFGRPVGVEGMRSVSGAFGRPCTMRRNEKCLRCFWSSCALVVL